MNFTKSFVKAKITAVVFILILLCVNIFSCSKTQASDLYNGEFLEKKLSMSYIIEGVLTQNGEKYDVIIESEIIESKTFNIKFMSGDVTQGLTVEFFENGVFLFFDDMRFKTNSETFTNLETLKIAFETLAAPYTEKRVTNTAPVDGIDILEIGAETENGNIKAYVNKIDGTIIRLHENLYGSDITLDIRKFENTINNIDKKAGEIFDVVDDYIEDRHE